MVDPRSGAEDVDKLDVLTEDAAQRLFDATDDLVQIEQHRLQHLPPTEGEELLHQGRGTPDSLLHLVEVVANRALGGQRLDGEAGIAEHHREEIVEVVRDAAGETADRLHPLRGALLLLEPLADCLGGLAFRNVADIALDGSLTFDQIDVADEAGVDLSPIDRLQRQVLIGDVVPGLELAVSLLRGHHVPERPEVPHLPADEVGPLVAEQVRQIRIDVDHLAAVGIEDQYAILGRLEEPPIAELGGS